MEVLDGHHRVPPSLAGGSIALGNFDGVHLGHQTVIGAALQHARAAGRPALVATFDPHPSRYFRPGTPPFALTSIEQRLDLIAGLGVDAAIVIRFDDSLASESPEGFARDWLAGRYAANHVTSGVDFSFGQGRAGSSDVLKRLGEAYGFTAEAIGSVKAEGEPISSTRVRAALVNGDMELAATLLTRPYTIRGAVIHGDKLGRTIGVPTANVELGDYQRPRFGVYAVRCRLPDGSVLPGVANLGIRPMFTPPKELLEVWIPGWSGDLYDQSIDTALVAFLREEMRFDGLDALKAQIDRDAQQAMAVLEG